MYTIRHYKKDFTRLTVAIVGDVLHSRVARSLIHALTTLGVPEVRVDRPEDPAADRASSDWACGSSTTCARACTAATWS